MTTFEKIPGTLSTAEAAAVTGLTVGTLAQYRLRGTGPRFTRYSRSFVLYRTADIQAWLMTRKPVGRPRGVRP